jgi:hypothetical protein
MGLVAGVKFHPVGVGLIFNPNLFCHGLGFWCIRSEHDPLPSIVVGVVATSGGEKGVKNQVEVGINRT